MPSLGKHDALAWKQIFDIEEIETARKLSEYRVETSKGVLQFDPTSKDRMYMILQTINGGGTVDWQLVDNSTVTLDYESMSALIAEAESLVGPKLLRAHDYAQTLKTRFKIGGRVTRRDVAPENWV
ncbi:hypothetical protein hairong_031 [Pseudomonas phage hairong]|nr:hypothetical protein hairong_031 [Pseudomonas phage hairong]